eukprot:1161512-Pelagomonas_calceolata.AAC.21
MMRSEGRRGKGLVSCSTRDSWSSKFHMHVCQTCKLTDTSQALLYHGCLHVIFVKHNDVSCLRATQAMLHRECLHAVMLITLMLVAYVQPKHYSTYKQSWPIT